VLHLCSHVHSVFRWLLQNML